MPDITITQYQTPAVEFNELGTIHPTGKYSVGVSATYFCVVYTINNQELDMTFFGDEESFICQRIIQAAEIIAAQDDTGDGEE